MMPVRFSLCPTRSVLQRLGQMRQADVATFDEIGDRVDLLQYAVVAARRKLQLAHRRHHQALARYSKLAVDTNFDGGHVDVGGEASVTEVLGLPLACDRLLIFQ